MPPNWVRWVIFGYFCCFYCFKASRVRQTYKGKFLDIELDGKTPPRLQTRQYLYAVQGPRRRNWQRARILRLVGRLGLGLLAEVGAHLPLRHVPVLMGVAGSSAALEVNLVGAQANDFFDADLQ